MRRGRRGIPALRGDAFAYPATLVFGMTTSDETCTLDGEFYAE